MQTQYISDKLNPNQFKAHAFNLVASGCGTGKTHWMVNNLATYWPDIKPGEMLFVTSRSLLVEQLVKRFDIDKYNGKDAGIRAKLAGSNACISDSSVPTIMTYDKLIYNLQYQNEAERMPLANIKVVVLDECHTPFSDLFMRNIGVVRLWLKMTLLYESKIVIGISATPEVVYSFCASYGMALNCVLEDSVPTLTARHMICTKFNRVPDLLRSGRLQGRTMIMCTSLKQCEALQRCIPNSYILASASNRRKFTEQMRSIRDYIIERGSPPWYSLEGKRIEVLICTGTAREGFNICLQSDVRNFVCCSGDSLNVIQFSGRARYRLDNIVVSDSATLSCDVGESAFVTDERKLFRRYLGGERDCGWAKRVAHLVEGGERNIELWPYEFSERGFRSFVDERWAVESDDRRVPLERRFYTDEDKRELARAAADCKILPCISSRVTYLKALKWLEGHGYEIHVRDTYALAPSGNRLRTILKPTAAGVDSAADVQVANRMCLHSRPCRS